LLEFDRLSLKAAEGKPFEDLPLTAQLVGMLKLWQMR
jgi:hypothetical protein